MYWSISENLQRNSRLPKTRLLGPLETPGPQFGGTTGLHNRFLSLQQASVNSESRIQADNCELLSDCEVKCVRAEWKVCVCVCALITLFFFLLCPGERPRHSRDECPASVLSFSFQMLLRSPPSPGPSIRTQDSLPESRGLRGGSAKSCKPDTWFL